jgi:light-independent protochlorophyllide reductase subunit B
MLVGASCTAELIQDDPGGLALALNLPIPVVALELPSYQRKENWGASETFYHLVRALVPGQHQRTPLAGRTAVCNILGPTALGFRHRDDTREIRALLQELGIQVNVVAPLDASVAAIRQLPDADFNVVLYPELARTTAQWLQRQFDQPFTQTIPYGVNGTGKRVFVFGDATHAIAAARVAHQEMGFEVVGLGTYSREFAREVRDAAKLYGVEALITDDYLDVEDQVKALQPELLLGTQMERHIAKRLGIPCTVISAPMHVQDFPARYAPQMGFEGANVLFDTWVHPLMMGLEEHLLGMFREDFEFHDGAAPSHLGSGHGITPTLPRVVSADTLAEVHLSQPDEQIEIPLPGAHPSSVDSTDWAPEAEKELKKIPFFVRGKARRNTELFARERGVSRITVETMYEAKAHFSR